MTPITEAYEVIDKLGAAVAKLNEASALLWDVRCIMESPLFRSELFWKLKELEDKLYEDIEAIADFRGRITA